MKIIEDGNLNKPSLLFLPGEFLPYSNYTSVLDKLKNDYRVYFVIYDGHDESERDLKFNLEETKAKIDDFFHRKNISKIDLVYSNSLGSIVFFELFKASNLDFKKVILDEPYINKNLSKFKRNRMIKKNTKSFLKSRLDLNKYKEFMNIGLKPFDNNIEFRISNLFKSINIFTENTIKTTLNVMYEYSLTDISLPENVDIVYWYDEKYKNEESFKIITKNIKGIRICDVDDKISKNLYFLSEEDLAKRLQLFYEVY